MFGGLHIELAALKTAGNLLESSGWTGALVQAGVATSGKADSFLKAARITRTRRAHQVTVVSCTKHWKRHTYGHVKSTEPNTEPMSLEDWGTVHCRKANQCSNSGSLSCSCSSPYSCLSDQSGLATSRCTSSH